MVDNAALTLALQRVGPRLRQLRLERDATLADLAAETGISVSTLSRLESGGRKPTLELLLALAKAHRVALDELVDAPETGDPRIRARPVQRHGMTFLPLTRRPGGLQAFKQILPPRPTSARTRRRMRATSGSTSSPGAYAWSWAVATCCSPPARWSSSTPAHHTGSATPAQNRSRHWQSTGHKANGCMSAPDISPAVRASRAADLLRPATAPRATETSGRLGATAETDGGLCRLVNQRRLHGILGMITPWSSRTPTARPSPESNKGQREQPRIAGHAPTAFVDQHPVHLR